jgi:hypothetical protein
MAGQVRQVATAIVERTAQNDQAVPAAIDRTLDCPLLAPLVLSQLDTRSLDFHEFYCSAICVLAWLPASFASL